MDLVMYEKKRAAINEVSNFILSTVPRHYLLYVLDKDTPWDMLSALKLRFAPTDRIRRLEQGRRYQVRRKATKNSPYEG
jgi:hypothetical protein